MGPNERIREIRKELGLTLEEFGARIGMNKSSLSKIETGKNGTTDQTIKSICREFDVNEVWLRTGIGSEKFISNDKILINRMADEYKLTSRECAVVSAFLKLSRNDRAAIMRYIDCLIEQLASNSDDETERIDLHHEDTHSEDEVKEKLYQQYLSERGMEEKSSGCIETIAGDGTIDKLA